MKNQQGLATVLIVSLLTVLAGGAVVTTDAYYKANAHEDCLAEKSHRFGTGDEYRNQCYLKKDVQELEKELAEKKAKLK